MFRRTRKVVRVVTWLPLKVLGVAWWVANIPTRGAQCVADYLGTWIDTKTAEMQDALDRLENAKAEISLGKFKIKAKGDTLSIGGEDNPDALTIQNAKPGMMYTTQPGKPWRAEDGEMLLWDGDEWISPLRRGDDGSIGIAQQCDKVCNAPEHVESGIELFGITREMQAAREKRQPWRPKVGEWVWHERCEKAYKVLRERDGDWRILEDDGTKICNAGGGRWKSYKSYHRPLRLAEVQTEEQAKQFYGRKVRFGASKARADNRDSGEGRIIGFQRLTDSDTIPWRIDTDFAGCRWREADVIELLEE